MASVLLDDHGFVVGSVHGFGLEARARLGADAFGFTIGTFNANTFEAGADFFRFQGIHLASRSESLPVDMYLLLPNLDARGFYGGSNRVGGAIGTSVTGLRVARCLDTRCVEASLRVGTIDAWVAGDSNNVSFALSVGAGLAVGIKL